MDQSSIQYRLHDNNAQWDPRKHICKQKALRGFCEYYDIASPELIDALSEFQCCSFVRYETYQVLHEYAVRARAKGLPELGWIQEAMLSEPTYPDFTAWFRKTKGWAA